MDLDFYTHSLKDLRIYHLNPKLVLAHYQGLPREEALERVRAAFEAAGLSLYEITFQDNLGKGNCWANPNPEQLEDLESIVRADQPCLPGEDPLSSVRRFPLDFLEYIKKTKKYKQEIEEGKNPTFIFLIPEQYLVTDPSLQHASCLNVPIDQFTQLAKSLLLFMSGDDYTRFKVTCPDSYDRVQTALIDLDG